MQILFNFLVVGDASGVSSVDWEEEEEEEEPSLSSHN